MKSRSKSRKTEADQAMLKCQESIGYLFRRTGLLRKALTHSSVKDEKNPSNERLEFLGDAILGMVISEYLFSMLPENDEGDLTKVKSVVVSSQTLSRLGAELGIDDYLLIGKGIRMKKEMPRSLIANAMEALIAAVYLDRGMEAARHFVLDHLHPYVEEVLSDSHEGKNYKSLLQQYAQKELGQTPQYRVLSENGPDHSKMFRVSAVLGNREFTPGHGAAKKEAEQDAARIALAALRNEKGRPSRRRRKSGGGNGRAAGRGGDRPNADRPESNGRAKKTSRASADRKPARRAEQAPPREEKAPPREEKAPPRDEKPAEGGKKRPSRRRRRRSKAESPKNG